MVFILGKNLFNRFLGKPVKITLFPIAILSLDINFVVSQDGVSIIIISIDCTFDIDSINIELLCSIP